jgi:hypothetical protein
MKVINLNESQYRRLFEIADYSSNEQDNMPGGIGSKIFNTAIKTNKDGNPEFGIDPDSEKIALTRSSDDRKNTRGAI